MLPQPPNARLRPHARQPRLRRRLWKLAKQDANAKASADAATAAAEKAAAKASDASQRAEEANKAAKDAQAAQQKGDAAGAAAAEADAGAKADAAKAAADAAAAEATKAEAGKAAAANRLRNDTPPNSGTIRPPTTDEQDDLDSQSTNLDEIDRDAKVKRSRARQLAKQASDLLVEEETKNDNQQHKVDEQKPGELPLRVPYGGGGTFFDVFFNVLPDLHYPNQGAPLMVPEVEGAVNNRALLRLLLVNDNPFDVDVTGVEGSLFGGGIDFVGSSGTQTVPANRPLELLLGLVTFAGPPGAYTFADFSIITDDSHPGLGPEFSANFATVPEPSTIVLLVTGAITGTWLRRRRRHGCARGSASTDGAA